MAKCPSCNNKVLPRNKTKHIKLFQCYRCNTVFSKLRKNQFKLK